MSDQPVIAEPVATAEPPPPVPPSPQDVAAPAVPEVPTSAPEGAAPEAAPPPPAAPEAPTVARPGLDLGRVAQDLQIRKVIVEAVLHLLDEGHSIPFIAQYRLERTGGLSEDMLRQIQRRIAQQRQLADRKTTILKSLQAQGKLNENLQKAILHAETPRRLDDLYLPFKPKKKSAAAAAREKGLEGLAQALWNQDSAVANFGDLLPTFLNPEKGLTTPDEVLAGVKLILAEMVAEQAEVRDAIRRLLWDMGKVTVAKAENLPANQGLEYKDYFNYSESLRQIAPHRILSINRGEKAHALVVKVEAPPERLQAAVTSRLPLAEHAHAELLTSVLGDALNHFLLPSLDREIRRDLSERAEDYAAHIFSRNLKRQLLHPPVPGKKVMALAPSFRAGCRVAVLDEHGTLLDQTTIHPFGPPAKPEKHKGPAHKTPAPATTPAEPTAAPADAAMTAPSEGAMPVVDTPPDAVAVEIAAPVAPETPPVVEAAPAPAAPPVDPALYRKQAVQQLVDLLRKHSVDLIALGHGPGSRDLEEILGQVIADHVPEAAYIIVNDVGAHSYAAGMIGREEFPHQDIALRSVISVGRRLQDPLSELVKVDPLHLGVGLFQHDLPEKRLKETVLATLESCVNLIGVDLNSSHAYLLRFISGLNQLHAGKIVEHRRQHGPFKSREQLKEVPGLGEAAFTQAAGFVQVTGEEPLDRTWVHPHHYTAARKLLEAIGVTPEQLLDPAKRPELRDKIMVLPAEETAKRLDISPAIFRDMVECVLQLPFDLRHDQPPNQVKKGLLQLEQLQPGQELQGVVQNVVDFGAFVDVGLKDSGLVHISQLANRFIKSPYDVVAVGDVVHVWVLNIDSERKRVSLTMIPPGTPHRPPEREQREQRERPPRRQGPPRGPAPEGERQGQPQGEQQYPRGPRPGGRPQQGGRPQGRPPFREGGGRPPRHQEGGGAPAQQYRPPPPRKDKPLPKLSKEALQGATPLRSFAELKSLFEAKKPVETKPELKPEETQTAPETPPGEAPPAAPPEAPSGEQG